MVSVTGYQLACPAAGGKPGRLGGGRCHAPRPGASRRPAQRGRLQRGVRSTCCAPWGGLATQYCIPAHYRAGKLAAVPPIGVTIQPRTALLVGLILTSAAVLRQSNSKLVLCTRTSSPPLLRKVIGTVHSGIKCSSRRLSKGSRRLITARQTSGPDTST